MDIDKLYKQYKNQKVVCKNCGHHFVIDSNYYRIYSVAKGSAKGQINGIIASAIAGPIGLLAASAYSMYNAVAKPECLCPKCNKKTTF